MINDRRILITGGNGYVGRYLTQMLMGQNEVCVADMLRFADWRFSEIEQSRVRLAKIDIRDAVAVTALMESFKPEIIVHLAAIHYIPECEQDPALAVSTNVLGTINLLTVCPEGCRFVLASSGAVYKPHDDPHREDTSELSPDDIYGLSKLHAEHYARKIAAKRLLKSVIVRLFNVIGPGETNPHLLPELVAQLKAGRDTVQLGNLSPRRDYIAVRDAARGFMAAALGGGVGEGETCVVNLGTSCAYSVQELIDKLRSISGINFSVEQAKGRIRKVDRMHLAADNRLIRSMFGWEAQFTLDDVLAEMWENPDLSPALQSQYR